MKEWHCYIILAAVVLLIVFRFWPDHRSKAHTYSGVGIGGNLIYLQVAKEGWEKDHKGGAAWPTRQDLLPYLAQMDNDQRTFDQLVRPKYDEIYLINTTGAPVFAYFPKTEWGYHEGETISLNEDSKKQVEKIMQQVN